MFFKNFCAVSFIVFQVSRRHATYRFLTIAFFVFMSSIPRLALGKLILFSCSLLADVIFKLLLLWRDLLRETIVPLQLFLGFFFRNTTRWCNDMSWMSGKFYIFRAFFNLGNSKKKKNVRDSVGWIGRMANFINIFLSQKLAFQIFC